MPRPPPPKKTCSLVFGGASHAFVAVFTSGVRLREELPGLRKLHGEVWVRAVPTNHDLAPVELAFDPQRCKRV